MGLLIVGSNRPDAAPEFYFNQVPRPTWSGRRAASLTGIEVDAIIQFCSDEGWRRGYNDANLTASGASAANPFHPEFLNGRPHQQWARSYAEGQANAASQSSPTSAGDPMLDTTRPLRVVDRSDVDWEPAWRALRIKLKELPRDHSFMGHTIDDFMLMGAEGNRYDFKDVVTRRYLHVTVSN